ncbi:MAG: MtrB/PioB family decaheme-associated outer membrane protein [Gemmatimonadetes bacterium]|nr:MtrB/PioB family decaheme-associated outer membrane protein [Gemmatimonadota bacterium]
MSLVRSLRGLVAVSGLLLFSATAAAQVPNRRGEVQFGSRQIYGSLGSSKFLEYRSIPEGLFVSQASLDLDWPEQGYYLSLWGRDPLEGDRTFRLEAGRYGRLAFTFNFDKTPHLFTTAGRSIYGRSGPGVFTIPDQLQQSLKTILATDTDPTRSGVQPDLAALQAVVEGVAQPVDLDLRREKGTASLRYTPTPAWDFQVQYSLENQRGARPFGATYSFTPMEQPEPIDYRTHEIRANVERAGKSWVIQAGYSGSLYRNEVDVLVFDNPFQPTDAAGNPSRGRIDLYPDNAAHQGTLAAAVSLPLQSRLTATGSYGVFSQNDPFQPFTINSAIANVPALPATSADARIATTLFNSALTTRPVPGLSLSLRYRFYERNNETPSLVFPGYVRTDQTVAAVARRNLPLAYSRQNASLDASWQILGPLTLRGGYEWEGWERDFRESLTTDENTVSGALDITQGGWLFLRAAFRRSDRTVGHYEAERVIHEAFPAGEPAGTLEPLEELRKFDQAARERNRAEVIARVNPGDRLSLSASYTLTDDDYHESEYGLFQNKSQGPAVELNYSLSPRVSLFAEYAWEENTSNMRSRQRQPGNDKPNNDWRSDIQDRINMYGVGLSGQLVPEKLALDLGYNLSDGTGQTNSWTPETPDLVTTAMDYPQIVSDLHVLNAALRYQFGAALEARLDYRFERYDQADFALDSMTPFMGFVEAASAGTVFLGGVRPDYRAHVTSVSFGYRF